MADPKTHCRQCGVEFLQSTADCTDGLCMPCFKGVPLKERKRDLESNEAVEDQGEATWKDWAKAGCLLPLVFFAAPLVGLIAGLIAWLVFDAAASTSFYVGLGGYLVVKVFESAEDIYSVRQQSKGERKLKDFKRRWKERKR